jgi:hypothetical protein
MGMRQHPEWQMLRKAKMGGKQRATKAGRSAPGILKQHINDTVGKFQQKKPINLLG